MASTSTAPMPLRLDAPMPLRLGAIRQSERHVQQVTKGNWWKRMLAQAMTRRVLSVQT